MKKSQLFGASFLMLGMVACNTDSSENNVQMTIPAYNIVTSLDDGETYVTVSQYAFDLDLNAMKGTISTDNLIINNSNINFKTQESPYTSDGYNLYFKNLQGVVSCNMSWTLNDANFLIAPLIYSNIYVPGYTNNPANSEVLFAQYKIGDEYQVRTFYPDALYLGTTTTTYPSADGMATFSTDNITYRVFIDAKNKKADIILYNAKFSNNPNEPDKTAVIVADLDVEFNGNGYIISGTEITPDLVEGTTTTPYPGFIFNELNFATTNNELTRCSINYKVAGVFTGSFTGTCIPEIK